MTAADLIRAVERNGGLVALALDGEKLYVRLSRSEAERLKPQLRAMKSQIVDLLVQRGQGRMFYLDACTCDEKPHPHFRHRDGTGPGSGRILEPHNPEQAHRRRR